MSLRKEPIVTAPPKSSASFQVRVTAANEAIPLADALVIIRRESDNEIVSTMVTGISGLTDTVTLPATDPALTLQPTTAFTPITYDVQVAAPGYYRVRNTGIPLYGGIKTLLPISMIPLPEFEDPDARELSFDTPRNEL